MNPYRTLPVLETTKPTSTAESLGHVRGWLEEMTDTNPYTGIDWSTYQIVLQWSSRSCVARSVTRRRADNRDYRPLVEAVLKQRLGTTGPSAHKVVTSSSFDHPSEPQLIDRLFYSPRRSPSPPSCP